MLYSLGSQDSWINPQPEISRVEPPQDGVTPAIDAAWTVDDLDRQHRHFRDEVRLVRAHSVYTVASYLVAYRNFRAFLVATVGLAKPIGTQLFAIDEWLRWNREQPRQVSQTTMHSYWTKLRPFFLYLERVQHGFRSPFHGRKPPTLPSRIPKARSAVECARILDATRQYPWPNPFDRTRAIAIIGAALFAGLRRSEILKLKYLDVDFLQGSIRVERGKGRGGGKDRVIPLSPDLREIMEDYLRERRKHNLNPPEFFTCLHSRAGISLSTFCRIIYRVRQASGIPFSFHALRHSFLTQLLRGGVPIHTVSALAGHTQITTTAGYLKVFDEDKEDALRRLRY